MKKLTTLSLMSLLLLNLSPAVAQEYPDFDEDEYEGSDQSAQKPPTRKLSESEMSAGQDFESFQRGPYFLPPHIHMQQFFGYERKEDFFRDFKDDVLTENDDAEVCAGELDEDAEGAVKLTFVCDDGDYEYSCYADLISSQYSVNIPSEVLGLSCKIQVEAVETTDDESDIELDGVETEEEVDLDSDSEITIDVEE